MSRIGHSQLVHGRVLTLDEVEDRVAVEIVPDGLGCVLQLVHDGLAPGSEESIRNGWNAMFDDLSRAVD